MRGKLSHSYRVTQDGKGTSIVRSFRLLVVSLLVGIIVIIKGTGSTGSTGSETVLIVS